MERLMNRLVRLELDQKLTNMPRPVNPTISMVPMRPVHRSEDARIGSPWLTTHTHGNVTASAAGHGDMLARNLPRTICVRLAGVSNRVSIISRSRAPLTVSAPINRPMNTPTYMQICSVDQTISFGGVVSSWLL